MFILSVLKKIAIVFTVIGVVSCASGKIDSIPSEQSHFELSNSEIRKQFPDIERYDFTLFPTKTPYVQGLIDVWGEPFLKEKDWLDKSIYYGILIGGAFLTPTGAVAAAVITMPIWPFPHEHYFWNKGNYCIEAHIDHTLINSYDATLQYWKWYELSDDNIPKKCNQNITMPLQ